MDLSMTRASKTESESVHAGFGRHPLEGHLAPRLGKWDCAESTVLRSKARLGALVQKNMYCPFFLSFFLSFCLSLSLSLVKFSSCFVCRLFVHVSVLFSPLAIVLRLKLSSRPLIQGALYSTMQLYINTTME